MTVLFSELQVGMLLYLCPCGKNPTQTRRKGEVVELWTEKGQKYCKIQILGHYQEDGTLGPVPYAGRTYAKLTETSWVYGYARNSSKIPATQQAATVEDEQDEWMKHIAAWAAPLEELSVDAAIKELDARRVLCGGDFIKTPPLDTAKRLISIFEKLGFTDVRRNDGERKYYKPLHITTGLPAVLSKTRAAAIIKAIQVKAGLSDDDLLEILLSTAEAARASE